MINVKKTIDFLKQMKKQNKNFNFNANYYTSIVSNYLNSQNIEDNKNNS